MFKNVHPHITLFFTRGVSLYTWDKLGMLEREIALYQRLNTSGIQVSFVTYGNAEDLKYATCIPGINILCNRWRLPPKIYEFFLPYLHKRHLLDADIYKANQTDGADIALRAARLFRKPLIARCGYMFSSFASKRHGVDSVLTKKAKMLEAQVFNAANRIVVTTKSMGHYVLDQYGMKATVIPNYVLTDLFRPAPATKCVPRRICFVGRLSEQKNLLSLIEAIKELNIELEIIGDGPQREILKAGSREKSLKIQLLGNIPHHELPKHFNAAEIYILPSLYEGHPKSLLEAMACGRPVISTDVPGIRELIRHRETGYLCGISPEEIRLAIKEVLADADLRIRMGRNARRFIMEHFAFDHVVEKELSLLKRLV